MKLRELEYKDANRMLLWMKDADITRYLVNDFSSKKIDDVLEFIDLSHNNCDALHRAIVNDEDEYIGTVSIKHINIAEGTGEFAIVVSSEGLGRGYAWFGLKEILAYGFDKLNLNTIYWCVSEDNKRAIKFYNKHGFHRVLDIPDNVLKRYDNSNRLRWYSVLKGDLIEKRTEIAGCPIINITTYPTLGAGELSFFEENKDIDFGIKRIYYISKVPEGAQRGFHAHKRLKQILFCPYGRILLKLKNQYGHEEIELSDPSTGIIIDKPTWREMTWVQKDSVLCVAASDFYDEKDYIRDYKTFESMLEKGI